MLRPASLPAAAARHVSQHSKRLIDNFIYTPPAVFFFWALLWLIARAFDAVKVRFPAPVAAMALVFGALLVGRRLLPDRIFSALLALFHPGVCFLLKWMAIFFSPALIAIPNGAFIGVANTAKVVVIFLVGMLVGIPGTAYLALGLRTAKERTLNRLGLGRATPPPDRASENAEQSSDDISLKTVVNEMAPGTMAAESVNEPLLLRPLPNPAWSQSHDPAAYEENELEMIEMGENGDSATSGVHAYAGTAEPRFDGEHPATDVPYTVHLDLGALAEGLQAPRAAVITRRASILSLAPSIVPSLAASNRPPSRPSSRPLPVHIAIWCLVLIIGIAAYFGTKGTVPTILLGAANVLAYFAGMLLPDKPKAILHPLLTCTVLMWFILYLYAIGAGIPFKAAFPVYLNDIRYATLFSATPEERKWPGAGDVMLSLLDAAVAALGFKLFEHRAIIFRYPFELLSTLSVASLFSMFFHTSLARALFCDPAVSLSLAPRSATTPLAIQVSYSLANYVPASSPQDIPYISLTAALVVTSGILGALIGLPLLRLAKIPTDDPLLVGIGTGATSHGIGTASLLSVFPEAGAISSVAFVGFGTFCVVWALVPAIGSGLVDIARSGLG